MVMALVTVVAVIVVGIAGVVTGLWLAFRWMRQFAPEREGELLAELVALRATGRLGQEATATRRAMLRAASEHGLGGSAA